MGQLWDDPANYDDVYSTTVIQRTSYTYDEIIFLSPDGENFNQKMANQLSLKNNLMLICGHYKGIDQRIRDHFVTKEISIEKINTF